MSKITWLHLSDYHWGERGQSFDQERSRRLLIDDIMSMVQLVGPVDAIFFTGDLVWSGKKQEYEEASKFLDDLLRAAGNLPKERLFIVPGNHDVDWSEITSAVAMICAGLVPRAQKDLERVRRSVNGLLGPDTSDRRRVFAKFGNYFRFVRGYLGWPLNAKQYFAVRTFSIAGKTIAVIPFNSAWMSPYYLLGEDAFDTVFDQGNLLLGERQVDDALANDLVDRADLCIALLHHPLSWLQQSEQSTIKARLYKRCRIILHGHLHEQAIEHITTPDGQTLIIPGGASYNRIRYPSGYNLVQLDLETWGGTIWFRRYFPERGGRWAADTGLYDNAPQGECAFSLAAAAQPQRGPVTYVSVPLPIQDHLVSSIDQAYLRYLREECSKVPVSPIDPRFVSITGYEYIPLDKVYIPLNVSGRALDFKNGMDSRSCLFTLQAMMGRGNYRFVLLGEPGSGKSTLVNYLTYSLAWLGIEPKDDEEAKTRSEVREELAEGGWPHLDWRPLRIVLREMAASGILSEDREGTSAQIWAFLAQDIQKHLPEVGEGVHRYQTWLFQLLTQQGGVVMFDGLDEVPSSLRLSVKQAIEDFARTLPNVCILVTCRRYAYEERKYQLADDFRVLELHRFNPRQVEAFVKRWYAMLASAYGKDAGWEQAQVRSLLQAIGVTSLAELAERPLFLTLMATLHSAWGKLPPDRARLYEDSIELLLERWQVSKEPLHSEIALRMKDPKYRDSVRAAIEEEAYKLHKRQGEAEREGKTPDAFIIEGDSLLAALSRRVENPRDVLTYIRDCAGLLLPSGNGYVFTHRSFQEHLAACHLFNNPNPARELAELVRRDPDWWRESFLLAVARAMHIGLDYALYFVNVLCPRERLKVESPSDFDWQTAEIAGAALAEIGIAEKRDLADAYSALLERVRKWLIACLEEGALGPIRRAAVGDTLARLGDCRPGVGTKNGLPDILWCEIPAGEFIMGNDAGEPEERPQHKEATGQYYISRYPITNAQFQAFVEAEDGYRNDVNWTKAGLEWRGDRLRPDKCEGDVFNLPNHPVVMISWYEADAFCRWLTGRMRRAEWPMVNGQFAIQVWVEEEKRILLLPVPEGYVVRLPTQAEFEKAARGVDGRTYPWGEDIDPDRANFDETGIGTTCAVGMFPRGKSPYGVLDIAGNAWSWCGTRWQNDYQSPPDERREGSVLRMVRGGGFTSCRHWLWCSYRRKHLPDIYHFDDGFRIVLAQPVE